MLLRDSHGFYHSLCISRVASHLHNLSGIEVLILDPVTSEVKESNMLLFAHKLVPE